MKRTRKSLALSILSLVLCISMLLGTTFAWFTDSVTSGVNRIVAGNLDINLQYYNGTTWEDVTELTKLFDDNALWEPGHTEVAYLKISNAGSLDLKYKMNVNVFEEKGSINVNGAAFKLSDYLVFGKVDMASFAEFADRAAARSAAGTVTGLSAWTKAGDLAVNGEQYLALIIYMPESVGNDANYRTGNDAPYICLGVNVVATQKSSEEDSFGSDYDNNADGSPDHTAEWTMAAFRAVADVPSDVHSAGMHITKYLNDDSSTEENKVAKVSIPAATATSANLTADDRVALSITPKPVPATVTVDENQRAFNFDISLVKVTSTNTETPIASAGNPVTVEVYVGTGLSGVKIFHTHSGVTTEISGVSYNPITGIASFQTEAFSDFTVVYRTESVVSSLPENAIIVTTLAELNQAVENLHNGDYIAFGAHIVQDQVDSSSGQITFKRAPGETGEIEATLNLNGYVFDGMIGGFNFPAENIGLKVNVIGTEKVVAEYYEHETGHHMVKPCAVYVPEGEYTTVLKSGLFESNNVCIMAYGGKLIVENGTIHNTSNEGTCLYACNAPEITINGGTFSCEDGGTIFAIEPYREEEGPSVVINGGTFDARTADCLLSIEESYGSANLASVVINGGTFMIGENALDDWAQDSNGALEAGSNYLLIKGGTFNVNPSAYVAAGFHAVQSGSTWTVVAD